MKRLALLIITVFVMQISAYAQIGIGTTTPNTSSVLDLTSTTAGLLIPRMTGAQKSAIASPAIGLMIYQTDGTTGIYYYNGAWTYLGTAPYTAGTGLTLSTNTFSLSTPVSVANGGTGATTFTAGRLLIGVGTSALTTTNANLTWDNTNSRLGISTSAPTTALDVNGTIQIGANGTTVTEIITATDSLDLNNILSNTSQTYTFPVTNAIVGSSVIISPQTPLNNGLIISYARVSVANTVEAKFWNSSVAAINMPGMWFYIMVIR